MIGDTHGKKLLFLVPKDMKQKTWIPRPKASIKCIKDVPHLDRVAAAKTSF